MDSFFIVANSIGIKSLGKSNKERNVNDQSVPGEFPLSRSRLGQVQSYKWCFENHVLKTFSSSMTVTHTATNH